MSEIAEAEPAEAKLLVHSARATAFAAACIGSHLELRGFLRFRDHAGFSHSIVVCKRLCRGGDFLFFTLAERQAELLQQLIRFLVRLRRCDKSNVHAANLLDLVEINFREQNLFL